MSERLPPLEQVVGTSRTFLLGVSFSVGHLIPETEAHSIEGNLGHFAMYQIT